MKLKSSPALRAVFTTMTLFSALHAPASEPMSLDVRFTMTDMENRPLPSVPVRLVFDDTSGWQKPSAGHRFATSAAGEHRLTVSAAIERRSRKIPTNFTTSLFSRAKPTDYLQIGAELDYGGVRRLHVIEIHRFLDGTVLRENFSIYSQDAEGGFTRRAECSGRDWKMADRGGLMIGGPGNEITEATLQPHPDDPAGKRWTLTLAFRRSPEPVRR